MNFRVSLYLLPLIYVLFLYGCKKDEDTVAPQIIAIAPSENTHYNTFDTIQVQATITDERELTFVSVDLLNADLIPVITPFGRSLSVKEYNLNASLIIDNIHLSSGTPLYSNYRKRQSQHYLKLYRSECIWYSL